MSPITTHVLDIAQGKPAAGVAIVLERQGPDDHWTELSRGTTNADGRLANLLPDDAVLAPGIYRLRFATNAYFAAVGMRGLYPEVHVLIQLESPVGSHYHIPLLLSPFGYSTYRGS
jgi:5-hydroxyisourate hydrolase